MNIFFSKIHLITKGLVAFVAAVMISEFLVDDVFLGYTPTVRTDVADRIVTRSIAAANIDTYLSYFQDKSKPRPSLDGQTLIQRLAEIPSQQIVPGVYAKESDEGSLTEIKYYEIRWKEVPYRRTGGSIETIRIPEGTEPPPPGLF